METRTEIFLSGFIGFGRSTGDRLCQDGLQRVGQDLLLCLSLGQIAA